MVNLFLHGAGRKEGRMSDGAPGSGEVGRILAIMTVIGAVVGAVGGAVGFSEGGINLGAGLIGLIAGAAVMAVVTLAFAGASAVTPPWFLQALFGGFLFALLAGSLWELKFETKWGAQLTGAVFGVVFTTCLVNRERIARFVAGKRGPPASQKRDEGSPP
jgi:hypothetical protein